MKKVLFIAVVAVASLASCKKDRTCTCTTTVNGASAGTATVVVYNDAKKGQAQAACLNKTTTSTVGSTTYTSVETCELK